MRERSALPAAAGRAYPDTGAEGERRVLALLSEEAAGRIFTRNAGAISFSATLSWCPGDGMPTGPALGLPAPGVRFFDLVQYDDAASTTRRMYCEIRALCAERLTVALDSALRSVTAYAALTEAILETNIVRLADPIVPPSTLVEELARQLRGAGFSVSFGPSWIPSPGADISLGTRGLEEAFGAFLRAQHAWQRPSR